MNFVAQATPYCEIKPESWLGSVGRSYPNGKPFETSEYFVVTRESPEIYCTWGQKSKKNCFSLQDKCLVHDTHKKIKGCYQEETGEIKWSHGYTSALAQPRCKTEGHCTVLPSDLEGQSGRSWNTRDPQRKTTSLVRIAKEGSKYCFYDSEVGKHCTSVKDDNTLVVDEYPWIIGRIVARGEIIWSHGYTTTLDVDVCKEAKPSTCEVTPGSWVGSIGASFKEGDPTHVEEYFVVTQESADTYCTWGQYSGKNCFKLDEGKCAVYTDSFNIFLKNIKGCYQEESGNMKWSTGYYSELELPCGQTSEKCTVTMDSLVGKSGRSYDTRDWNRKTTSTLTIGKEDDKYCFDDTAVGKNCATLRDDGLLHFDDHWVTGRLEPNGLIVWGHGYTTELEGDLCAENDASEPTSEDEDNDLWDGLNSSILESVRFLGLN